MLSIKYSKVYKVSVDYNYKNRKSGDNGTFELKAKAKRTNTKSQQHKNIRENSAEKAYILQLEKEVERLKSTVDLYQKSHIQSNSVHTNETNSNHSESASSETNSSHYHHTLEMKLLDHRMRTMEIQMIQNMQMFQMQHSQFMVQLQDIHHRSLNPTMYQQPPPCFHAQPYPLPPPYPTLQRAGIAPQCAPYFNPHYSRIVQWHAPQPIHHLPRIVPQMTNSNTQLPLQNPESTYAFLPQVRPQHSVSSGPANHQFLQSNTHPLNHQNVNNHAGISRSQQLPTQGYGINPVISQSENTSPFMAASVESQNGISLQSTGYTDNVKISDSTTDLNQSTKETINVIQNGKKRNYHDKHNEELNAIQNNCGNKDCFKPVSLSPKKPSQSNLSKKTTTE